MYMYVQVHARRVSTVGSFHTGFGTGITRSCYGTGAGTGLAHLSLALGRKTVLAATASRLAFLACRGGHAPKIAGTQIW